MAADQTVKLENDSGSHERVALDLMNRVIERTRGNDSYREKQEIIDLYVDCLWATYQNRTGGK